MFARRTARRRGAILVATAVVVGAFCSAATTSAKAAEVWCYNGSGKIKLSPGLTNTPVVQEIQVKGELTECVGGSGFPASLKFQIHAVTTEPVTCVALTRGALTDDTKSSILIKAKRQGMWSSAAFFELFEAAGSAAASYSYPLSGGILEGRQMFASFETKYERGPECGKGIVGENGRERPAKKVNKGVIEAALVGFPPAA
jgi:hypothetical protein